MDEEECYRWGELFTGDWDSLVSGMSARAETMGLLQEDRNGSLIFDIFRMSPHSYLWHFNRVYTRPG